MSLNGSQINLIYDFSLHDFRSIIGFYRILQDIGRLSCSPPIPVLFHIPIPFHAPIPHTWFCSAFWFHSMFIPFCVLTLFYVPALFVQFASLVWNDKEVIVLWTYNPIAFSHERLPRTDGDDAFGEPTGECIRVPGLGNASFTSVVSMSFDKSITVCSMSSFSSLEVARASFASSIISIIEAISACSRSQKSWTSSLMITGKSATAELKRAIIQTLLGAQDLFAHGQTPTSMVSLQIIVGKLILVHAFSRRIL